MDAEEVARYLEENPLFFEQHSELLSRLTLPHPSTGQSIPLTERQVLSLRERGKALEAKLAELIQFGEENDAISEKMHRLVLALLAAASLDTLLAALYLHLREDFEVPHAALRLWTGRPELVQDRAEFAPSTDALKEFAASLTQPYCGPSSHACADTLFGEAAPHVRSAALMALREPGATGTQGACIGLLGLGSEDAMRFYPEMGTLYLKRLGEIASAGLARLL